MISRSINLYYGTIIYRLLILGLMEEISHLCLLSLKYKKRNEIFFTRFCFFTIYGSAGRPDMAYFGFTSKLVNGNTVKIFNYGNCKCDFIYIDHIVEDVMRVMKKAP